MSIVRACRAELSKVFTVRLWWILAVVMVLYVGALAGILAGVFGSLAVPSGGGAAIIDTSKLHLLVYSTASAIGYVFPVLLGALSATSEFRHQTLTPTFLANPRRAQVLVAKAVSMALIGALFGVIALVGSIGVGAIVLSAVGESAGFDDSETWAMAGRVVLAMALWAVIGVALGTLVPNQVATLVIVLAFTQFVEPLLRSVSAIWEWTARVGQFLPGSASDALVGWSVFTSLGASTTQGVQLDWWQGGLVLFVIAAVVGVLGYFVIWKRDVT